MIALARSLKRSALPLLLSTLAIQPAMAAAADDAEALHVLNRLGNGPAPDDLAHVRQIGVDRYVDEQLHPERIDLPPALQHQLDGLGTTRLSERELVAQFRALARSAKNDNADGKAARRDFYQRVMLEAGQARLLRAIESPRQLQEVMVDFWFNHFNVYNGKGLDRALVENYERKAIRPYAMGKFRDLLGATAHHAAMLFYLDNWLSTAPGSGSVETAPAPKSGGLNENYARELMELHTLGVDGGYTQKDVTELARMMTGWTLSPRARSTDSLFFFDPRRHDDGDKEWLGHHVAPRGQAEGEWALDVLAAHPSTARHISSELAQYFVADTPPPALVDRLAERYTETGGDIGKVLATLFASHEFRDPSTFAAKFKTPYQYVVSSVRASNLPVGNVRPLLGALYGLGMPLYGCQTPDGYKNTEAAWLNPDGITRRINFATALAAGRMPFARPMNAGGGEGVGARAMERTADRLADPQSSPEWTTAPVDAEALLGTLDSGISNKTRMAVEKSAPALKAAMLLGSPDFMHH